MTSFLTARRDNSTWERMILRYAQRHPTQAMMLMIVATRVMILRQNLRPMIGRKIATMRTARLQPYTRKNAYLIREWRNIGVGFSDSTQNPRIAFQQRKPTVVLSTLSQVMKLTSEILQISAKMGCYCSDSKRQRQKKKSTIEYMVESRRETRQVIWMKLTLILRRMLFWYSEWTSFSRSLHRLRQWFMILVKRQTTARAVASWTPTSQQFLQSRQMPWQSAWR